MKQAIGSMGSSGLVRYVADGKNARARNSSRIIRIWATWRNGGTEQVDTASTMKEAHELCSEYRMAYGPAARAVWAGNKRREVYEIEVPR